MADSHIVMLQILESESRGGLDIPKKVSVQLQRTEQGLPANEVIVKSAEKRGLFDAVDMGAVWLVKALAAK
ncbi:MAG: hypothetical protein LBS90_00500 [Oscillospiraceae bacterium]|jgi:hypothetical protein|nr:hypothetical protein [Oscillospiraceae bacterium]